MAKPLLYTAGLTNGLKVSIMLEELKAHYGLEYDWKKLDMRAREHKADWFLEVSHVSSIVFINHTHTDQSKWNASSYRRPFSCRFSRIRESSDLVISRRRLRHRSSAIVRSFRCSECV